MRRLLLFASVIMLAACSTKYEQPVEEVKSVSKNSFKVSEEEAIERLEKMLSVFDPATRGKKRTIKEIIPRIRPQTRAYAAEIPDTMYYYVNFDDNDGYAVLAADERAFPILALIDTGNYVPTQSYLDLTKNLVDSLNQTETLEDDDFWCFGYSGSFRTEEMIEDLFDGYVNRTDSTSYTKKIVEYDVQSQYGPYLKTSWGQGDPYNRMCNSMNPPYAYEARGFNAGGCVAVAIAQIINYHQYPSSYEDQTLNWDLTKDQKHVTSTTQENIIKEVARIIKAAGRAADTSYGEHVSSSNIRKAKLAFRDEFGYNVDKKGGFNESDIRAAILDNEPVFFAGKKNSHNGGHAWVIDGYRNCKVQTWEIIYKDSTCTDEESRTFIDEYTDYFYHCNFGWDGKANGYYAGDVFRLNEGPAMLDETDEQTETEDLKWWKFKNIFVEKP